MDRRGLSNIAILLIAMGIVMALFITALLLGGSGQEPEPLPGGGDETPTPPPGVGDGPTIPGSAEIEGEGFTADGTRCKTGPKAVEGVLFKWDFESIQFYTCDESHENTSFCDPTQFSISLAHRLEKIKEKAEAGDIEMARLLSSFNTYLIADNYSLDFQKDFAHYYGSEFFATPAWFEPWHQYFSDTNLLEFFPRNLATQESGLYNVELFYEFDGKEFEFFKEGVPTAKIEVRFSRIGDFDQNSVFHRLPFGGMVGTAREDEDGETRRKDYGLGFSTGGNRLIFDEQDRKTVDSSASGGFKEFIVAIPEDFRHTNGRSGIIAFIDEENKIITFSPQYARVVLALLEYEKGGANFFYRIFEEEAEVSGSAGLAYWSRVSQQKYPQGVSLGQFKMPRADERAGDNACESVKLEGGNAYGLSVNIPEFKTAMLKSYFFTPLNKNVVLEIACSRNPEYLATEDYKVSGLHDSVSLDGSSNKISQFYELLEFVREEQICVVEKGAQTYFYWNAEALEEQENNTLERMGFRVPQVSTQSVGPKGLVVTGGRQIIADHYLLSSRSDGETRKLQTPEMDGNGEIFLTANVGRFGVFCFERPLVQIYNIGGGGQELLLESKSNGFLGVFPEKYRGTINKGESLKLTAKGFKKALCFGSGSAEAHVTRLIGSGGIAVYVKEGETNYDCVRLWLAEGPDSMVEECTVNWGGGDTTNVKPNTSIHFADHCYESPGEHRISYECSGSGERKTSAILVKTPQYPENTGLLEGENCTGCQGCCDFGLGLRCIPAYENSGPEPGSGDEPPLIDGFGGEITEEKVCCPRNTKWDGELCLDIAKYTRYFRAEEYSEGVGGELFLGLDSMRFSDVRDADMEAFLERQEAAQAAQNEGNEDEKQDYGERPEGWPEDWPWPPDEPEDQPGGQEGGGDSCEVYNVSVEIYFEGESIESVELRKEERWARELHALANSREFGAVWKSKGMEPGDYTAKFHVNGCSFNVVFEKRFSIDESGEIHAASRYSEYPAADSDSGEEEEEPGGKCIESDKGIDPGNGSKVYAGSKERKDGCLFGRYLFERYCKGDKIKLKIFNCRKYCRNNYGKQASGKCSHDIAGYGYCLCSGKSISILSAYVNPEEGELGAIFTFRAAIENPESAGRVGVEIFGDRNAPKITELRLYDDGKHNDLEPEDGVFANTLWTDTNGWMDYGDYNAKIYATGPIGQKEEEWVSFSIVRHAEQCKEVLTNGPSQVKLDLVFLGQGFESRAELREAAEEATNQILSFEPFSGNREKINVSVLPESRDLSCSQRIDAPGINCNWAKVEIWAAACENQDRGMVLLKSYGGWGQAHGIWGKFAVSYKEADQELYESNVKRGFGRNTWSDVVTHELGHLLGLLDEYVYEGWDYGTLNPEELCEADPFCEKPPFLSSVSAGWNCTEDSSCSKWKNAFGEENIDCAEGCTLHNWFRPIEDYSMMYNQVSTFSPPSIAFLEKALEYFAGGGR